mgnify:CR=1 FL=1
MPRFGVKKHDGQEVVVDEERIIIEDIGSSQVKFKINFENPHLLSLSDQTQRDEVTFDLARALIGQNGLPMKTHNMLALEGD